MNVFEPFLRLEVAHAFFGATPPPIVLEPDAATARLFKRDEFSVRLTAGLAEIFAIETRGDLALFANDGLLTFLFRVRPKDASVVVFTEFLDLAKDQIAVATIEAGAATGIGEAQLRPRVVDDIVTSQDVLRPPLAILRVTVPLTARAEVRQVRFAASRRCWTYYVLGGDTAEDIHVRDRDGDVAFDALGALPMSNGRQARAFRSQTPIVANVRPPQRFELVGAGAHGERVLISTLPCPLPDSPRPPRDDPAGPPVSEVYVTLP